MMGRVIYAAEKTTTFFQFERGFLAAIIDYFYCLSIDQKMIDKIFFI